VINQLSSERLLRADGRFWHGHQNLNWLPFDTNMDGYLSTIDVLGILNHISRVQSSAGEAEQGLNGVSVGYKQTTATDVDSVHAAITRDGIWKALRLEKGFAVTHSQGEFLDTHNQSGVFPPGSAGQISQGLERVALINVSETESLVDVDHRMTHGLMTDKIIQARLV
jgi:hypothetical protein